MKNFVFSRAASIARKEVHHVWRDKFTLTMALGIPVFMVIFFGYVLDYDIRDIKLFVVDRDQTVISRQLVDVFRASGYFHVEEGPADPRPTERLLSEKSRAVLVIEPGFSKDMRRGIPAHVQMVMDGADNQTAGMMESYAGGIQLAAIERLTKQKLPIPVAITTRFLYNTDLNSRWFIIPGLSVVVVGIISILLTALTVAREWENGSMELLLSTPVRPLEIIVGKLAPYTFLGLGGVVCIYLAARLAFGVPFKGSHLLFIFTTLIYLATTLSQGLLISVLARQQQVAMQFANITGMLPSMLLSGFIFPVESMPAFFQYATAIIPARWFMIICRGLFLKGAGITDLLTPLLALLCIHVVMLMLAAKNFKKDLEP